MSVFDRWREHASISELDDLGEHSDTAAARILRAAWRSGDHHRSRTILGFFLNREGLERDFDK
jgi:hypothetical protein